MSQLPNRITVKVMDMRHYKRIKAGKDDPKVNQVTLKLDQPVKPEGRDDVFSIASVLINSSDQPDLIISSPQPRAWKMAKMVIEANDWLKSDFIIDPAFDDTGSDPNAKPWIDDLKKFCKEREVTPETGFFLFKLAREYMFARIHKMFASLVEHAIKLGKERSQIMIVSHGGAVEMRSLAALIADNYIPLDAQTAQNMEDMFAELPNGMSEECEGFEYELTIDTETKTINKVTFIRDIRLPRNVK